MEAKKLVQAQMPSKLIKEARTYAAKKDLTMSQILRLALAQFLSAEKGRKE